MQDGAFAHQLKMAHSTSKDLDGHMVMHMHNSGF